jgi:hypothetical protein
MGPADRRYEETQTVLVLGLLALLFYFWWRTRELPALLMFTGWIPVAVFFLHRSFIMYLLHRGITDRPFFVPSAGFTRVENPWLWNFVLYVLLVALCLPVAWFVYVYRATIRLLNKHSSSG